MTTTATRPKSKGIVRKGHTLNDEIAADRDNEIVLAHVEALQGRPCMTLPPPSDAVQVMLDGLLAAYIVAKPGYGRLEAARTLVLDKLSEEESRTFKSALTEAYRRTRQAETEMPFRVTAERLRKEKLSGVGSKLVFTSAS